MTPTDEQQTIIDAFNDGKKNILISARAGAAKTTTLRMLTEECKERSLYLAFNRRVVEEARDVVPDRCKVMTLNGIGHQTLARYPRASRKNVILKTNKNYTLLKEAGYKGKKFVEMLRAVRLSKQYGFVDGRQESLIDEQTFFETLDMNFTQTERAHICNISNDSWRLAIEPGIIDFDDQILVPTLKRMPFIHAPVVFVDEAQDLSAINRRMIKLILGFGTRFVAVGDEAQAIYGFRGADHESMPRLAEDFKMEHHKLTMTFRCSEAVTKHANWRTGDMRCAPQAKEGSVEHKESIAFGDISTSTAILCRNNAPLLRVALRLMRSGYAPKLLGRDILEETIKSLERITKPNMAAVVALGEVDRWADEKKQVWKSAAIVDDKADCMRIFLKEATNAGDAIGRIRALRDSPDGNITLSTIHKAKGAEYEHVILIDKHLIGVGIEQQEDNLMYVAQTRARDTLRYVAGTSLNEETDL